MTASMVRSKVNWHQAIAEVSLILVGIVIALFVDNWWDERTERGDEIKYLQSLRVDFLTNREMLYESIAEEVGILALGDDILSNISSGLTELSPKEYERKLGDFLWTSSWTPAMGTYDELVGSGRLSYIQSDELRVELATYERLLQMAPIYRTLQDDFYVTRIGPFLQSHANFAGMGWLGEHEHESPFPVQLERLETREFWNLVAEWMSLHVNAKDGVYGFQQALSRGDEILSIIDAELARKTEIEN